MPSLPHPLEVAARILKGNRYLKQTLLDFRPGERVDRISIDWDKCSKVAAVAFCSKSCGGSAQSAQGVADLRRKKVSGIFSLPGTAPQNSHLDQILWNGQVRQITLRRWHSGNVACAVIPFSLHG